MAIGLLLAVPILAQAPAARAQVALDTVPGWAQEDALGALATLRASCRTILSRTEPPEGRPGLSPAAWGEACEQVLGRRAGGPPGPPAAPRGRRVSAAQRRAHAEALRDHAAAVRAWLEGAFVAVPVGEMLVTGYYEPVLRGSRTPTDVHNVPLFARPPDLVERDVTEQRAGGVSVRRRVWGRAGPGGRVTPYLDRAAIETGGLERQGLELVWVDNAVDAFFMEIQGSGRVVLPDGQVLRVGFAGQNGHPFVPIGRTLIERNALPGETIGMQSIRGWLNAVGPERAAAVMRENPSYIFFRIVNGLSLDEGPIGALGVPLTPGRSVAIDPSVIPLGAPLFMSGDRTRRLLVAQDTGGAIKGARADLFFGWGDQAGAGAGNMRERAQMYMLAPRDGGVLMASIPGNVTSDAGAAVPGPGLAPAPGALRGLMLSPGSAADLSGSAAGLPGFSTEGLWTGRGGSGPRGQVARRQALARGLAEHEAAVRRRQAAQRGLSAVPGEPRAVGTLPPLAGSQRGRTVFTLD
ncbi:MltA domain-containing protein, partial [Roseomonas sp. NAR14]